MEHSAERVGDDTCRVAALSTPDGVRPYGSSCVMAVGPDAVRAAAGAS